MADRISLKEKIGYSLGDAASNFYWKTFEFFLMIFYTDVFGISAAAAGSMLFVIKIINAFTDPVIGAAIGLFILPRAFRLGRDAVRVLVQAAPADLVVDDIDAALRGISGVGDVHDLHVWTLTSEMEVASAHMMVTVGTDAHAVLDRARELLLEHDIAHATIQVEPDDHAGGAEVNW